jgi:hypothetical protein
MLQVATSVSATTTSVRPSGVTSSRRGFGTSVEILLEGAPSAVFQNWITPSSPIPASH